MSRTDEPETRGTGRETSEKDVASCSSSVLPGPFAEDLDAVVAAPAYHTVILENEHVRVLDTIIPRGHKVPLHTHRWPAVSYLVAWSDCIRRDRAEAVLYDSRGGVAVEPGTAFWVEPMTEHTLENVGEGELHVVTVEMKA